MKKMIRHIVQNKCPLFLWAFMCYMILTVDAMANVVISSEDVSIHCNQNSHVSSFHEYNGEPNTQLTLVTNELQLSEEDSDSSIDNINVNIVAECLTYHNGKRIDDTTNTYNNMWPPGKTLVCEKGDGMAIIMFSPTDANPDKYIYKATMTKIIDDGSTTAVNSSLGINGMRNQPKIMLKKLFSPIVFESM